MLAAIEKLCQDNGFKIIASCPAHENWQQNTGFLKKLEEAHLVIVNGEGTIHHDRPDGIRLLEVGGYAKNSGIPAALINFTWEANSIDSGKLLQDFQLLSVRDTLSLDEIRAFDVDGRVVPDLSLLMPWVGNPNHRHGIGFTDSVVWSAASRLEEMRDKLRGKGIHLQYSERGVNGCYRFIREYIGRSDLGSPTRLLRKLKLRVLQYLGQNKNIDTFISELQQLELLVSGRFHACTLALVTDTPFIAVASNTKKIAAMIEDAGLETWRGVTELTAEHIEDARKRGWSSSERIARKEYLAMAQYEAEKLFRNIKGLL